MADDNQEKTHQNEAVEDEEMNQHRTEEDSGIKDNDSQTDAVTEVLDSDDQKDTEGTSSEDAEQHSAQTELEQLRQENEDLNQRLLRAQAEFDNFKKRSQKEKEATRKYQAEDLVKELLPVIDNFERALQVEETEETKSVIEGITMVYNQMKDALKSQGVEPIESVGKPFDPTVHHAVMQVEDEQTDSEIITEELQKGYYLKDRVIRPAMVKVNK